MTTTETTPVLTRLISLFRRPERTYREWCRVLARELGVIVLSDDGRRACERDGRLDAALSRGEAVAYFAFNSLLQARTAA